MQTRIAEVISEYSSQGIHRTGTDVDNQSAAWLMQKIESLGVLPPPLLESTRAFLKVIPRDKRITSVSAVSALSYGHIRQPLFAGPRCVLCTPITACSPAALSLTKTTRS